MQGVTGETAYTFTADDRDALARILTGVPPTRLAAVAGDLFTPGQFPAGLRWSDTAAVVDRIAVMERDHRGVPPLFMFASRVAAELPGGVATEIARWVDAAADAVGVDRATLAIDGLASVGDREPESNDAPFTFEAPYRDKSGHNRPRQLSSRERPGLVTGQTESAVLERTDPPREGDQRVRIWGRVPLRNPAFTGREALLLDLQRALESRAKASVLPHALHGLGGVGKTQLAVEFAYRYADRYDIVWWIPAEHQSLVLQSLNELGRHLDVPDTAELQLGASLVLEQLAESPLRWLLIYDNATEPEDIAPLMPSGGGNIILTSRNQTWSDVWDPIQVDTFRRAESVELVRKRSKGVSERDADRLAARLGDLPLALDQAASCQAAMGISITDYLTELEEHVRELAGGTAPVTYQTTIAALVRLALRHLRTSAPAVAELLELFAYLGAEPISGGLLRRGREARVTPALGRALRDPIGWDRAVRDLRRYGLAKVHPDQRIQVHRLFQGVLRDRLSEEAAQRARSNVHQLLASANPGNPKDETNWPVHADIGPHIGPADLVHSDLLDARRVVLDQVRYLTFFGDPEGSRRLGDTAFEAWSKVEGEQDFGPNGGQTLVCAKELSIALRQTGFNDRARDLADRALIRLRESPEFGPDHEYTIDAADAVAVNLRVAGRFDEALRLDEDTLGRSRRVFGEDDEKTLDARRNLAVNLRMLSDFTGAYEIDSEVVRAWQQVVSENDNRLLFAQANLARDLYGLGRYGEALTLLGRILPPYRQQRGGRHPHVLLAERTLAITLRKVGRYAEALAAAADHHRASTSRYGAAHEHALAAAVTHANTLRVSGDLLEGHRLTGEALDRYRRVFGERHPLTMAASVNYAILLRGLGELDQARELGQRTYSLMQDVLGTAHGYTLCAASGLANDLALAGETDGASRLSEETLSASRRARGERHPYTLTCAVNAALDVIAAGQPEEGTARLHEVVSDFEAVLGADHPETVAAREGQRAEIDIEPPPT